MFASESHLPLDSIPRRSRLPWNTPAEQRYVEMRGRLNRVTVPGAFAISTMVTLSCFDDKRLFAILLGVQLFQIPFNVWVNLRLLRRLGPHAGELFRNAVNLCFSIAAGHLAHWPIPAWLWLPFIALTFEQLGARLTTWTLISTCVIMDGLALMEGVSWIYPVSFSLFAVFCAQISRVRFEEMRDMLSSGDIQRLELERAHLAMMQAHESLTRETAAREMAELELRQAHKLEAVGRLAAGIAHELNTPVQFVGDNLRFTRDSLADTVELLEHYANALKAVREGSSSSPAVARATEAESALDSSFLVEEIPRALEKSLEGIDRIAAIVRSIKEFARPDQKEMTAIDLNDTVNNVLAIARNEYAEVATVDVELAPLPRVTCHPGEINQVMLNLVVNAAQAIGETPRSAGAKGRMVVRTALEADGKHVVVSVADDGPGIPRDVQPRIFEPFFTTKPVGKGVGQGLAVSRAVILRHRGSLTFESTEGEGTTFSMRLPVDDLAVAADANPRF
jgi:signal transduction histidine kinase